MNNYINTTARMVTLPIAILAIVAVLTGCDRAGQGVDAARENPSVGQPAGPDKPLGQVMEFDSFTLRANVSRADVLSDDMARQHRIEANPDLALLNLVIQDNQSDRQSATVEAAVTVQYQTLLGQIEVVEMRPVEADGYISYIGTLDASSQRIFKLTIKAQPNGTEKMLEMDFDVQLDW